VQAATRKGLVKRNVGRSLGVDVDFSGDSVLRRRLDGDVLAKLRERHPVGKSKFWGATATNYNYVRHLEPGDIVLFVTDGEDDVWGWGTVGVTFHSGRFGEALWESRGGEAFEHIFSIANFTWLRDVALTPIARAVGVDPLSFRRPSLLRGVRGDAAREAFLRQLPEDDVARQVAEAHAVVARFEELAAASQGRFPMPIPGSGGSYEITSRQVVVDYAEARLVSAFLATLPEGAKAEITRTSAGISDLVITWPDGSTELVEAKSGSNRSYARQVLAQLLDYAPTIEPRPSRVSGLFPEMPSTSVLELLARYGVRSRYFDAGSGEFRESGESETGLRAVSGLWR
jgi:hypothetical protein